tara:strand:+ start:21865 stop:22083 length:219 start_codon:yes stop_codon:yes gene_type:complete
LEYFKEDSLHKKVFVESLIRKIKSSNDISFLKKLSLSLLEINIKKNRINHLITTNQIKQDKEFINDFNNPEL